MYVYSQEKYILPKNGWIKYKKKKLFTYAVNLKQRDRASKIRKIKLLTATVIKARYCTCKQDIEAS